MVIDDVDNDCQAVLVAGLDEVAQPLWATVGAFDSENVGGVVTPRVVAGELHKRHEFNSVDPQVNEVVNLGLDVR